MIQIVMAKRLILGIFISLIVPFSAADGFDTGKSAFTVKVGDLEIAYREFALFLMPGEKIRITSAEAIELESIMGGSSERVKNGWYWSAPKDQGYYPVRLSSQKKANMMLNLFVMRPASDMKDEMLDEYRIGQYSKSLFRKLSAYRAPAGFVEVQPEFKNLKVSPHFRLGQFLSKQASSWPKYLVLRPELIIKLERILEQLNQHGIKVNSLEIMSGFRTPWYNRAIGNRTTSSRHLYGGAADIFIDVNPRDGIMDDLNKDGRVSRADAEFLYDLLDRWSKSSWWSSLTGGLAAYGANSAHGPFVHIDARGYKARWGR